MAKGIGRSRLGEALPDTIWMEDRFERPVNTGKAKRRRRKADGTELCLRSPESSTIPCSNMEVRLSGRVGDTRLTLEYIFTAVNPADDR